MSEFLYGTFLRVRENRLILTGEPILAYCRKPRIVENLATDRSSAYNGYLSVSAGNTIEKRLTCWFNSIFIINRDSVNTGKVREFLPVMITVTLSSPQQHDDKWIKRNILQEFLKALARKKDIRFSFWKAEAQLNGNIHFHVLIDRYIDMKFIQGLWNYYQKKAGYMDDYFHDHKNYNAPSTKVTGMKANKSPIKYVLKYIKKKGIAKQNCKGTESGCKLVCAQLDNIRRPIDGAVFRFSSPLVALTPPTIYADMDLHAHLKKIEPEGKFRYVHCDYCDILYCNNCKAYDLLLPWYQNELDVYYRQVFDMLYNYIIPEPEIIPTVNKLEIKAVNDQLSFLDIMFNNALKFN